MLCFEMQFSLSASKKDTRELFGLMGQGHKEIVWIFTIARYCWVFTTCVSDCIVHVEYDYTFVVTIQWSRKQRQCFYLLQLKEHMYSVIVIVDVYLYIFYLKKS